MSDATALWAARNSGAMVASGTSLGRGCVIHPFAMVGFQPSSSPALARKPSDQPPAIIGDETVVMPYAMIYAGVVIGRGCLIGDHASIREGCVIGDNCVIGSGVTMLYDAVLDADVRVQSDAHITGKARIGRGVFIGVGVITCNDKRRDLPDYVYDPAAIKPPIIGDGALIGSGAVLLPGVVIGERAIIGAGALVTKNVPDDARVLGQAGRIEILESVAEMRHRMMRA